jgi:hypothetical protein
MADAKRLTGEDGEFYHITKSSKLVGNAVKTLDVNIGGGHVGGGYFQIAALAAVTVFDAALTIGDIFWDDGSMVPAIGDDCYYLAQAADCSITGWSLSFSKSEIETTTLCDTIKAFRAGKSDASGSLTAIRTTGGVAADILARNKFTSQFINLTTDDGAGNLAKYTINDDTLFAALYTDQETTATNIEEIIFVPMRLTSHDLEIALDSGQAETIAFRVDGSQYPQVYQRVI